MSSLHFVVSIGEGDQLNDRYVENMPTLWIVKMAKNVESGKFSISRVDVNGKTIR